MKGGGNMDGFLGIDIGTTNSKALLLSEDGKLLKSWKERSPEKIVNGHHYIDIPAIEKITDQWTEEAECVCDLKSIGFSSIGESVIPIKNGKAMYMPLVWYEDIAVPDVELEPYSDFEHTGVHHSATYSLYKILWMEKNVLTDKPDFWLPVCSYLAYRKTGTAMWDTSQAGRSYMYDIHKKEWISEIRDRYDIRVPDRIGRAGQSCGEKDGVIFGLGGHDHYVGLFAVHHLCGGQELFYDSMGSSSVLAAVMDDSRKRLRGKATYDPKGGCLVTGFRDSEYVVNRSMDYYGRILDRIRRWNSGEKTAAFFERENQKIGIPERDRLCLFACGKGYGRFSQTAEYMNCLEVKDDTELSELIFSAYIYLSLGSREMYRELSSFCSSAPEGMPYFAGGGITENRLFMILKATAVNREINVLNTTELSALGAVISGMHACKRDGIIKEKGEKILYREKIYPEPEYMEILEQMRERYEER